MLLRQGFRQSVTSSQDMGLSNAGARLAQQASSLWSLASISTSSVNFMAAECSPIAGSFTRSFDPSEPVWSSHWLCSQLLCLMLHHWRLRSGLLIRRWRVQLGDRTRICQRQVYSDSGATMRIVSGWYPCWWWFGPWGASLVSAMASRSFATAIRNGATLSCHCDLWLINYPGSFIGGHLEDCFDYKWSASVSMPTWGCLECYASRLHQ